MKISITIFRGYYFNYQLAERPVQQGIICETSGKSASQTSKQKHNRAKHFGDTGSLMVQFMTLGKYDIQIIKGNKKPLLDGLLNMLPLAFNFNCLKNLDTIYRRLSTCLINKITTKDTVVDFIEGCIVSLKASLAIMTVNHSL